MMNGIITIGIVLIVIVEPGGLIELYRRMKTVKDRLNAVEFILSVGLNDKDTCKQEIPDDAAVTIV